MLFLVVILAVSNGHNDNLQTDYLESYYHGTPPPQDQCIRIADIPDIDHIDCPMVVGPPHGCPFCYTNEANDYTEGDTLTFTEYERKSITELKNWYLDWWINGKYNTTVKKEWNVFRGSAGRSNIFLRVYMQSQYKNETLLNIAKQYMDNALDIIPPEDQQISGAFMKGHIGVWTIKAIIDSLTDLPSPPPPPHSHYLEKIRDTFRSVNDAIMEGQEISSVGININDDCTLDSGLAGMLYNALLLNKYFEPEIIDFPWIENIIYHCLDVGIETGKKLQTNYLQFYFPEFPNCAMYGPGHGSSGFIKHLFNAYKMYPEQLRLLFDPHGPHDGPEYKYYNAIKNTLDLYLQIQLDDGNTPTNVEGDCASTYAKHGMDEDSRVQWCHGSPAFQNIFFEASLLYEDKDPNASNKYYVAGVESMDVTWERGLLAKGTMFCHGIAGNINMFLESAYFLKQLDEEYLSNQAIWRAKQFTLWALDWNNLNKTKMFHTDWDYSMFQGPFGIPMLYSDILQGKWPNQQVCQPNWNLCV